MSVIQRNYRAKYSMRDLLDTLDAIAEASLEASQIIKYPERFDAFITHIKDKRAFYTNDGTEVVLDPREAARFIKLKNQNQFRGALKARDLEGREWPLSGFRKTAEFGGASAKPGEQDSAEVKKEGAQLKPSQIKITDRDIPAKDLGSIIVNNPVLQSTDYGRAVIQMAQSIMAGETAQIPPEFAKNEQIKKAIVDYAGEYLGVLALIYDGTDWLGGAKKKADFLKWLGGDIGSLMLNFPSDPANQLADSYAEIRNTDSGHTINISSKGTGGGAPPSLSGLKIPDHVKKNPNFQTAIDIIELTQNEAIPMPKTVSQVFLMMNLLNERVPEKVPKKFKPFLPWPREIILLVNDSRKNGTAMPKYRKLFQDLDSRGADGGKLTYVVKKAVIEMVNGGAVPEFQETILEILDYNFIQQYAKALRGALAFSTQWPAKLDGVITMESKSGGTDPTKGGLNFKLSPAGAARSADDLMPDDEQLGLPTASAGPEADLDQFSQKRTQVTAAPKDTAEPDEKSLGRKRRR
jgi:hypothetical protein